MNDDLEPDEIKAWNETKALLIAFGIILVLGYLMTLWR
jgi:hypothetical protein